MNETNEEIEEPTQQDCWIESVEPNWIGEVVDEGEQIDWLGEPFCW
jgi:hypothetical protein